MRVWWAFPQDIESWHLDLLDGVERERYARLRQRPDRDRFAAACALLRLAVAAHLGRRPSQIQIARRCPDCGSPHGKPRIDEPNPPELSVSHSGHRVAVAMALGTAVGVDVEALSPGNVDDHLAGEVLAADELARFAQVAHAERRLVFLSYWTRKESVLKAAGVGLRVPPASLVVSAPDAHPRVLSWTDSPAPLDRIRVRELSPGAGYVAALAVIGPGEPWVRELDGFGLLGRPPPG